MILNDLEEAEAMGGKNWTSIFKRKNRILKLRRKK
jgi:hypothetical protein